MADAGSKFVKIITCSIKFKINYLDLNNDFKVPYEKKLEIFIKKNKINQLVSFEIEDKFFEKKIRNFVKNNSLIWNKIKSPMFLNSREEFNDYLFTLKNISY